jgi:ABC-type bacteriocin/lantibiotic exporter with double-glycine peptidase domain
MPALALILGMTTASLAVVVLVALALVLLLGLASMNPEQRMIRERRRHAERTARTVARMSKVRALTIRRMDEAERRWRP